MSEVIPCELKQCETSTHEDEYVIVQWPEIQEYMHEGGFDINSSLANDEWSLEKYGSSAYFVRKSWLNTVLKKRYEEEQADDILSSGEMQEVLYY